jgi:hypothetical protein
MMVGPSEFDQHKIGSKRPHGAVPFKGMVLSGWGKGSLNCHVRFKEMNVSEPLIRYRNSFFVAKNKDLMLLVKNLIGNVCFGSRAIDI